MEQAYSPLTACHACTMTCAGTPGYVRSPSGCIRDASHVSIAFARRGLVPKVCLAMPMVAQNLCHRYTWRLYMKSCVLDRRLCYKSAAGKRCASLGIPHLSASQMHITPLVRHREGCRFTDSCSNGSREVALRILRRVQRHCGCLDLHAGINTDAHTGHIAE